MTDHPNATDYRNLAERNEAFWREIAGELARRLDDALTTLSETECGSECVACANANAAMSRYTAAIGDAKP